MRPLLSGLVLCALSVGCGGQKASIAPPRYDPDAITQAVLAGYDANKNGSVEAAEADACPALKAAFRSIDTDRNGALSADELKQRFTKYDEISTGFGPVMVTCQVSVDGAPAKGVKVQLVPESFMGGQLKSAAGTTDEKGAAVLAAEDPSGGGVYPGLYRVVVTRPDGAALPARYNTRTTLGQEVFGGGRANSVAIDLKLTSS